MLQGSVKSLSELCLSGGKNTCSFPSCVEIPNTSPGRCKACAACAIVHYCSKDCQKADWKRHKALCKSCRPFKEYSTEMMTIPQKTSLDEFSKIRLPPVDEEYRRRYGADIFLSVWLKSGLSASQHMIATNIQDLNGEEDSADDMRHRWQEVSPALDDFLMEAIPGDIFYEKAYRPYDPCAPQQFRNTPMAEPMKLENGRTLVDIGFVDFGFALDSIDTLDSSGLPLKVVGYESSPQCVAKSLVMLQMMKDDNVEARSIVEVWLSSLWTDKTFHAFRKAISGLLVSSNTATSAGMHSKVRAILKFWKKLPKITRQAALNFQLEAAKKNLTGIPMMNACGLKSESDRVEYIRYFVTKALYEDSAAVVGSPVMGKNNEKVGVKQIFESCVEAVTFNVYTTIGLCDSFMGRIKKYFEEKIQTFTDHVRNGTLLFTPKYGTLSPDNPSLTREIKKLKPFVVHWSNVIDYISPRDFHTIAKEISGSDTVHVAHSCNWTSRVYGTDVYDINPAVRLHFYSAGLNLLRMSSAMTGGIVANPPRHFRSICSLVLTRKFVKKFFRYFFNDKDVNCGCTNGNVPLKMASPFSRSDDTIHFCFAYKDTGIAFGEDTYDYMVDDN